ncbi:SUN domain-containing protein 2 isoform X3 [Monodelphis domestica]|uniref:SUN domain-containing protein 2 isoform X3 n=1 Tax=Monodelphis domestica TaxID=13616 RepID=UPI0024E1ADDD|nr:SUN domain-containing protein 2 isoform X3 [Monodelphis domestica]
MPFHLPLGQSCVGLPHRGGNQSGIHSLIMSRRSQRLIRYSQGDDDGGSSSSSASSSLMIGQHVPFKDSPLRALRRKSGSMKRLSPAPHLGSASKPHTSYYSESVVSESYGRGFRAPSVTKSSILHEQLDSDSSWSGDLMVGRRRGIGGPESSKINMQTEDKISYDTYGSSSGYSSEDDYSGMDQPSSVSRLSNAFFQAGAFLWMVVTFPGRFFGLFYWWLGTTWYRLTTAASLLDVFVLTRCFASLKKLLLSFLMMMLLASLAFGAWYFYPYGLKTFHPALFSWWAAKGGNKREVWEPVDSNSYFKAEQHILSRVHALERRLETVASEFSALWQKEATRMEHLELRLQQGASGNGGVKGLSQEDSMIFLEGLWSRREAVLKEECRRNAMTHIQEELTILRAEYQQYLDNQKKIIQAFQDLESRFLQLKSDWQSLSQEEASQRQAAVEALQHDVESQGQEMQAMVQAQLRDLEHRILTQMAEEQGKFVRETAARVEQTLDKEGEVGITEEKVHRIVNQALKRYSEDRIGLVDYALESGGASVISTRCSETYDTKTALLSLFGIPLWYRSQSPRAILQPDVYPGNCWAFQGTQGFAVIRLSALIRPTAVTLEHVPKALTPISNIPSAPKDFIILGLNEDLQQEGAALGYFTYDQNGEPIQTFHLQSNNTAIYQVVELRILSNWGHPEYTCIYRFRVHGEPVY